MPREHRMPGAFEFMANREYDIFVTLQPHKGPTGVRRIVLMYAERGLVASVPYNLGDPTYNNERARMYQAAVKALLNEVRSRLVANQEFVIWFTDEEARRIIEREAGRLVAEEPAWQRAVDKLVHASKIVHEAEKDDQAR